MKQTGGVGHPLKSFHPNMASFYLNIYMYLARCEKTTVKWNWKEIESIPKIY